MRSTNLITPLFWIHHIGCNWLLTNKAVTIKNITLFLEHFSKHKSVIKNANPAPSDRLLLFCTCCSTCCSTTYATTRCCTHDIDSCRYPEGKIVERRIAIIRTCLVICFWWIITVYPYVTWEKKQTRFLVNLKITNNATKYKSNNKILNILCFTSVMLYLPQITNCTVYHIMCIFI